MTDTALTPEEARAIREEELLKRHPAISKEQYWYEVTSPNGESWTFEDGDMDPAYIESALYCWSRWLDFVLDKRESE